MITCLLLVALSLRQLVAQDVVVVDPDAAENVLPEKPECECSDITPRLAFDGPPSEYECFIQEQAGNCNKPFMMQTITEVPEGYCQVSCGRCGCCSTVADVLRREGASEFAAIAEAAGGNTQRFLNKPGWEVTVFAPDDEAMRTGLASWGIYPSNYGEKKEALRAFVEQHTVPRHPDLRAVYTTPFLTDGVWLNPLLDYEYAGESLTFQTQSGSTTVGNSRNRATIVKPDIEACKSMVNIVNSMLSPASLPPEESAASEAQSSG